MSFVQIQCTRCKTVFRDRAGRLQDGYTRQCPSCEVVLFFAEDSPNPQVKQAMKRARRARKEQRETEMAKVSAPQAGGNFSRSHTGRIQHSSEDDEN